MDRSQRDVDEGTFVKFKVMTVKERIKIGEALTNAMKNMLKEQEIVEKRKRELHFFDEVKPLRFGKGSENTSEQIYIV